MDKTYYKQLYRDITENFYHRFDDFITVRWSGQHIAGIREEERKAAYRKFYQAVKHSDVANRQTIRRWFGLDEETSLPSRKQIFKIALAVGLSPEETEEYLMQGISQPGFQMSDYREYIIRYCLEHRKGRDICRKMIDFYEQKGQNKGKWEQESNTNWIREQYTLVKGYSEEEFVVWMCKHQRYFKGYSLTNLQCYRELLQQCMIFLRKDVKEALARALDEAGFFEWQRENGIKNAYNDQEIERFVKNRLRSRKAAISQEEAREIRKLASMAYAPQDRMSDLVLEIYSTMPGRDKHQERYVIYNALGGELKRVDRKYISELLNMAVLKEKQMVMQMELAAETDEKERRKKEKELKKFRQRIHLIGRSDLLVLAQYIIYRRLEEYSLLYDKTYSQMEAQKAFREYADGILEMCGMRKIDRNYLLDHVLLECFAKEEMYLFSEVIEGGE